jgi:DNA polymerase III delta prime subunit
VRLILTTSKIEQVLPTIQSRCVVVQWQAPAQSAAERAAAVEAKNKSAAEISKIYSQICSGNLSNAITLADTYKERDPALQLVQDLIMLIHQQNQQQPKPQNVQILQNLLATQNQLEKNVNVKLALEELFFSLCG